uniref:Uncharacterized protein LOC113798195 n=1 Tax=Dermatophagoides pteronyssinus TaxID=6956 RepID=A0A6P6YIB2_DERPT|nr:uncharacterized protein LOC113798195 [Dermatophagoides pteronyssinus]
MCTSFVFGLWIVDTVFDNITDSNNVLDDEHFDQKNPKRVIEQQQQDQGEDIDDDIITLNGATVLNPPFIYSESGPYRGFCVDILKELGNRLKFQFTLRQSFDGQIGSIRTRDGVFGEIIEKYVEFAIGDISSNWLNTPKEAEQNDIVFTRPIYISTMKVLLTKSLFKELVYRKRRQCQNDLANIKRQEQFIQVVFNDSNIKMNQKDDCAIILNDSSLNTNIDEKNGQFFHYDDDGNDNTLPLLTIHDIFNQADIVRIIFKGSAVHRFYSTINIDYLNDLIIVERASLSTLLQRLQRQKYVLIDESKFIDYFVDHHDCEYTSIDVARRQRIWLEMNNPNVHFDTVTLKQPSLTSNGSIIINNMTKSSSTTIIQQLTIRKEELFQNNIAIAFSKTFIEQSKREQQKNWSIEFNKTLDLLEKEGILKTLRDRHWLNNCRREGRLRRMSSSSSISSTSSSISSRLTLLNSIISIIFISIIIYAIDDSK